MLGNALVITTTIFVALGFFLMQECEFLIPYRHLLWTKYADSIAIFAAVLFVNVLAAVYAIGRKLFLKDTGQKLAHLEKQLRTGSSLSEELARRLREEHEQIH
jgi:hypothetical protein